LALLFAPLEHVAPWRALRGRNKRELVLDLVLATLGQVLARACLWLGLGAALSVLDPWSLSASPWAFVQSRVARAALELATGLLVFELAGYGYHRLAHRVPLLWRMHALHHSSQELDWLAAFRQHPLELVLMTLVQNAPLVLLGLPLGTHAAVLALLKAHAVFVHANLEVPDSWLAYAIALPSFHHRHHDERAEPKNFASLFPFIDRVFDSDCRDAQVFVNASSTGAAMNSSNSPRRAIVSA
jgi:sterol desaturase/sphingolipid hydroxylase (fatty acid hydroxylase superfamily)